MTIDDALFCEYYITLWDLFQSAQLLANTLATLSLEMLNEWDCGWLRIFQFLSVYIWCASDFLPMSERAQNRSTVFKPRAIKILFTVTNKRAETQTFMAAAKI